VGGNFIDTANKYTEGTSERYIGEFIANDRNRLVWPTSHLAVILRIKIYTFKKIFFH
jgi:predicted aldo/keto reductase-like oxidoreductase